MINAILNVVKSTFLVSTNEIDFTISRGHESIREPRVVVKSAFAITSVKANTYS
jgi:hypothetical protein